MASSSTRTYLIEGIKISVNVLKDISGDLPPPASAIANLISRVIEALEVRPTSPRVSSRPSRSFQTLKNNREQCDQLQDRILRLLLVVIKAIKEGGRTAPPNLSEVIEKFRR